MPTPNDFRIREPGAGEGRKVLRRAEVEGAVPRSVSAVRKVIANEELPYWRKEGADLCVEARSMPFVSKLVHRLQ